MAAALACGESRDGKASAGSTTLSLHKPSHISKGEHPVLLQPASARESTAEEKSALGEGSGNPEGCSYPCQSPLFAAARKSIAAAQRARWAKAEKKRPTVRSQGYRLPLNGDPPASSNLCVLAFLQANKLGQELLISGTPHFRTCPLGA